MSGKRLLHSLCGVCLPTPRIAPCERDSLSVLQLDKQSSGTHSLLPSLDPTSKDVTCKDVFQLDNGPSVIARASFLPSTSPSSPKGTGSQGPRIICKLSKPGPVQGNRGGSGPAAPSATLSMPAGVSWDTEARRKRFDSGWLQLEAMAADASALAALSCKSLEALGVALKALLRQDTCLAGMLSAVAFSVAAPTGAACDSAASCRSYFPTGPALKGFSSVQVSGAYMRDPDDGTLYPTLSLELRSDGTGEDWILDEAIDAPKPKRPKRRSSTAASVLASLSNKDQRNLLRASTVLAAAPYISTLLELDMDELAARPSPRAKPGSNTAGALQEPISGRVLLQNAGSLQYWGKLPAKHQTGAWQMFDQLLQDTPHALDELLQHLKKQRANQDADPGSAHVGRPWKKVVCVPSHDRSFSKMLRDQLKASRPAKDPKDILASWLLGGSRSMPQLARPPVGPASPKLQPLHTAGSLPLPAQMVVHEKTKNSTTQSVVEEHVFAVAPSKQVMSMMAAVGGINKQSSLNPRRLAPSSSASVRAGDSDRSIRSRFREGGLALQPARSGASQTHATKPGSDNIDHVDLFAPMADESESDDEEDLVTALHSIQEDDDDDDMARYHEVQVIPVLDQLTGKETLLLIQTDITSRTLMEQRIAALTESQLRMLEGMYPRHILEFVMGASGSLEDMGAVAHHHPQVTILFMDVVGFTSMSKEVAPKKVMEFLNLLFRKFDNLCDTYNVYKVETAGDCYIVAGSLMTRDQDGFVTIETKPDGGRGAKNVLGFGQAMLRHARSVIMPHNGQPTSVRIGIHSGSVTSGLIGTKQMKFGLFGDTMNTSSRMESTGRPGCIQISEVMHSFLAEEERALFEPSGGIEVKGKGLMPTFIWTPKEEDLVLRAEEVDAHESMDEQQQLDSDATVSLCVSRRPSGTFPLEHSKSTVQGGSQWNVVRSALKATTAQDSQEAESKRELLRSRLSRIARGAKSTPVSFEPDLLEQHNHPGFVSKQSSMYMMQEILQLMRATVDE